MIVLLLLPTLSRRGQTTNAFSFVLVLVIVLVLVLALHLQGLHSYDACSIKIFLFLNFCISLLGLIEL